MPAGSAAAAAPPSDLVELGAVSGAYGVQGWVRVSLRGSDGAVLERAATWWLLTGSAARPVRVQETRRHGQVLLARWEQCDSKESADALKGASVAVPRSEFPLLPDGEYYWSDLLGCRVVNRSGAELGLVSGLRENRGGQWLEVTQPGQRDARLVPLNARYVDGVDLAARCVQVDWDAEW
jgi:16S rRNA processing protein RimM